MESFRTQYFNHFSKDHKRGEEFICFFFVYYWPSSNQTNQNAPFYPPWDVNKGDFCLIGCYFTLVLRLRASSYEPGNRAGSATGTNSVVCSYEKFQPGLTGMNSRNATKMVEHKLVMFATVIAL